MSSNDQRYLLADNLDSPVGGVQTATRTLPGALLKMIPGRLRMLALIWTLFFGLTLVFQLVIGLLPGFDRWPWRVNAAFVVIVVVSLGVVAAVARFRLTPRILVAIGLAYEVIGALAVAVAEAQAPYGPNDPFRPGVSWVGVWIVLVPLVVPSKTVHTVFAICPSLSAVVLPPLLHALCVDRSGGDRLLGRSALLAAYRD